MIVARGESMEAVSEFFKSDPYQTKGLAEYKYVEFKPANYQQFLNNWLED